MKKTILNLAVVIFITGSTLVSCWDDKGKATTNQPDNKGGVDKVDSLKGSVDNPQVATPDAPPAPVGNAGSVAPANGKQEAKAGDKEVPVVGEPSEVKK